MSGLIRLRVVIVVAMAAVVAVAAGAIFDRFVWWLLLVPSAVGGASLLTLERGWILRVLASVAAGAGATAAIVVLLDGDGNDLLTSFGPGFQRLLSTDWPSPDRPALVGTIAAAMVLVSAASTELAQRTRLHLAPLLPIVVGQIGVIALSAPNGLRLRWLLPLALLAAVLATMRPGSGLGLRERLLLLRGERRLVPVSLLAIGLAAGLAGPIALADRADPRRNDPAERTASLLDPIEATLALQAIDPPIDLHDIRISEFGPEVDDRDPVRWRTAALVNYDGRVWTPELTLRPIGRRLGPPSDDTITAAITFLDDDLQLVPLPGAAITIDASIETDPFRTVVRLTERPTLGEEIELTSRIAPTIAESDPGRIGIREIDENSTGFTELATALVGAGGSSADENLLQQLQAIELAMREDFVLRTDAPGGGLQRALIDRFLRDTQRGNAEQFTTSFVLLVRSLGVDARVATGFEVDSSRITSEDDSAALTLSSMDARIWAEVRIGDGWVAFDPVPDDEDSDAEPPPPEPQVQTPAAPQPPIAPPPESADEPLVTDDDANADSSEGLPVVVTYALATAAGISALLIPIILVISIILGVKWRRRRGRLSGTPLERIRGTWAVATDRLVDAGMVIDGSDTNDEIAIDAAERVPAAQRELRRLATLASATTFGDPVRPDLLVEDATGCLGKVETSMTTDRSRWQRLRWRLSLRSLRSKTASPV